MNMLFHSSQNYLKFEYTYQNKKLIDVFKKEISENLIFIHCSSIHTFFMKRNIDVIFFDKDKNLLEVHKDVKKNKILICKKAYYIVEVKSNLINYKDNNIIKLKES